VSPSECKFAERVQMGVIMVDGLGIGDVGNIVIRDRKHLTEEGILTVEVTIEREKYTILAGPDIITRGFVYMKKSNELINKAREIVRKELEDCLGNKIREWSTIKSSIRNVLSEFLYIKTKRKPIIIPIIMGI